MRPVSYLLAAAGVLLGAIENHANAAEKVAGFDTFHLVRTRNMFDPNRRPPRPEPPAGSRPSAPGNRSSSLVLTGTMVSAEKVLAFFGGTRADYSRVLSTGDTIADGKIMAIKATEVEIERAGKRTVLAVGHQLQIDGVPSDQPVAEPPAPVRPAPESPAAPASPAEPANAATASPAPTTNHPSDVLRRMMERRAKEMSK